jgi:monoamine oxidase
MRIYTIFFLFCHMIGTQSTSLEVDVAIIGAGLSGLSAAKGLATANKSFVTL